MKGSALHIFDNFQIKTSVFMRIALGVGTAAILITLGVFAYLGTFTRYLADDYCDTTDATSGSVIRAQINRYLTTSNRYSNFFFDALSEFLLPRKIGVIPVIMIVLWTLAMIWLISEIRSAIGFRWAFLLDIYLGASVVFFAILEAPNRFQTFYWRSAMATHFVPLVYLTALCALLIFQIRRSNNRQLSVWVKLLFMMAAFIGGGFSEPPDMILIVASFLAWLAIWKWDKGPRRFAALTLLAWIFAGGIIAFMVMILSPANASRLGIPPPDLVTLLYRTLIYTIQFIIDSLKILPFPTLVSVGIPFLVFYSLFAAAPAISSGQRRILLFIMAATPILMYILIAASFAPSAYGESYPEARARFAGRLIMIIALMLEGACFGFIFAQWKIRWQQNTINLALALLTVSTVYSLRAAWIAWQSDFPVYSQWALDWDVRQQQILSEKALGKQDIVIPQLSGVAQVKELDTSPNFWANRCAAAFYGVHSISAPQYSP